tara:strand:- start:365 stop:496 length:132 start_codon:yes stop_codon:yes gene_type:complete
MFLFLQEHLQLDQNTQEQFHIWSSVVEAAVVVLTMAAEAAVAE